MVWSRDKRRYDTWLDIRDFGEGFRADNGFVPDAGYRSVYGEIGLHYYPKGIITFLRPYVVAMGVTEQNGRELRNIVFPGFFFQGRWNSEGWLSLRGYDQERVGGEMVDTQFVRFFLRASPFRFLPTFQIEGDLGDRIDFANDRLRSGGRLIGSLTFRPTDHFEMQLNHQQEWLDVNEEAAEGRLFTAAFDRLKLTYTFSARSLVRVIAQNSDIERNPLLYDDKSVRAHDQSLRFSALYGYKLNWQTVFFVGYGDNQLLDDRDTLQTGDRSLFMKVAYAFQR